MLNSEEKISLPGNIFRSASHGRQGKSIEGAARILGTRKWLSLEIGVHAFRKLEAMQLLSCQDISQLAAVEPCDRRHGVSDVLGVR